MAGLRTAPDDRWLTGGIVVAVWLVGLAVASLLFSLRQPAITTPAPAPAAAAAIAVSPVETLPPTVVVAERAEIHAPDCRAGERNPADHRCAAASLRRDIPGEHPNREPARDAKRGPLP
jgi:hypothetical protein